MTLGRVFLHIPSDGGLTYMSKEDAAWLGVHRPSSVTPFEVMAYLIGYDSWSRVDLADPEDEFNLMPYNIRPR